MIKKVAAMILIMIMTLSFTACGSKYTLSKISLTGSERSWTCPDEKYTELVASYEGRKCNGTMVVATDEDVIYLYCEDALEKDGKTPVSQDTIFDIGSVSKTFTAVSVLQLQEKGKLSMDDTLDKYFPDYDTGKDITISNLLHMSSGISDYINNPDPFWNISGADAANQKISDILMDKVTDEDLLKAMYQAPLEFEPGTQFSYSNTNYRLLAFIIEQVSGMKYCDYVKKNIFDKCGMTKTSSMAVGDLTYVPLDFEDLVYYGFTDDNGYPVCPNNTRGDGGIHSCLTDLLAFDRALFGGKLLDKESMKILLTDENGYCCGLFGAEEMYYHDGSSLTCSANNKIIESEEYGHIYMIKLEHSGLVESDSGDSPMSGTNYTKGTYEDGIYINEYAGLRMNVSEEFVQLSEDELVMANNAFLSDITDSRDYTRESSSVTDQSFWDDQRYISYEIMFLNTSIGVPDDPDYTENEYLDDVFALYSRLSNEDHGIIMTELHRDQVTLCGNGYLRSEIEMDDNGEIGHVYFYARRLDDDLMCIISISTWEDISLEELESVFI